MFVAYGRPAVDQARLAIESLHALDATFPALVIGEAEAEVLAERPFVSHFYHMERDRGGRWQKLNALEASPFDLTVYLDADTRVRAPLDAGFAALENGWDLAIAPSSCQGDRMLWHVGQAEKMATLASWPCRPLQLQGGVMFFRRSKAVETFFERWREEWMRYEGQDQAALLRALIRTRLKIWLLGWPWSNGAVVGHLFGRAKRGGA